MMAFVTVNKRSIISLHLAFTLVLFLVSSLPLVAHARDISSSRRIDAVMKKVAAASSVLQDAELVESSDISSSSRSSQYPFETKQKQENLRGAAAEGIDDDLLVVDYTPVRSKSPIHN
ncbi:hypothetical protein ACLB2K_052347 [Fragaria x ananassa]